MLSEKELEGIKDRTKEHFGKRSQKDKSFCSATEEQGGINYQNFKKRRKDGALMSKAEPPQASSPLEVRYLLALSPSRGG